MSRPRNPNTGRSAKPARATAARGSRTAPPTNAFSATNQPAHRGTPPWKRVAQQREQLYQAVRECGTVDKVIQVLDAMHRAALEGNVAAASVWLERVLGREVQPVADAGGSDEVYTLLRRYLSEQRQMRGLPPLPEPGREIVDQQPRAPGG